MGTARALRGRVVVAYVLVDPAGPRRWTEVDRVFARSTLARVERWYAAKATARSVVPPQFVDRVFEVPLAAGDLPVFPDVDHARSTALQLVANMGYDSLRQWLAALAMQESADQVMLVVHSPQNARSFSSVCRGGGGCDSVHFGGAISLRNTTGAGIGHVGPHTGKGGGSCRHAFSGGCVCVGTQHGPHPGSLARTAAPPTLVSTRAREP